MSKKYGKRCRGKRYDYKKGKKARDAGIDQGYENAYAAWKEDAYAACIWCARRLERFICDAVQIRLEDITEFEPHDGRALGGVMRRAQAAKIIAPTNIYKPSQRINSHLTPRMEWRSLIFGTPPVVPPAPKPAPLSGRSQIKLDFVAEEDAMTPADYRRATRGE